MNTKKLIYFIMLLSGIVVGTLISGLTSGIDFLRWLSYGIVFGTNGPISLELGVISLDFGISFNLTISCIICILIAMIVAKKVL